MIRGTVYRKPRIFYMNGEVYQGEKHATIMGMIKLMEDKQ